MPSSSETLHANLILQIEAVDSFFFSSSFFSVRAKTKKATVNQKLHS